MLNIKQGEILAFKTDTVWGFGALPDDKIAIEKIYDIKKRDLKKPLILMSYDFEPLKKYVKGIPNYAYKLIEKYLPGGLTLIFKKTELCSNYITPFDTVGIRIPDSIDFMELTKNIQGGVLATTSCNVSSEAPVKNYKEAMEKFKDCATIIKPFEDTENENIPSTVVLCKENGFEILRQGKIEIDL